MARELLDAIFFITLGLAGMTCNLIVIVVIHSRKPLQTSCFRLISGGAFGGFMVGSFYFVGGIRGLLVYVGYSTREKTRFRCLIGTVTGIFGIAFHSFATCLIGIDRLISLIAPVYYRNLGGRYVIAVLSISGSFVLAEVIFIFAMTPLYESIECVSFSRVANPIASAVYIGLNFFLCSLSVVVYCAMLGCFYIKSKKYEPGSAEHNIFMKQQAVVMPTVRLLAVFLLVCGVLPEVIIGISSRLDETTPMAGLHWTANVLVMSNSLVEFVSLALCCERFRTCMKSMFCRRRLDSNTAP